MYFTEPVQLHGDIIGLSGSSSDKHILQHFSSTIFFGMASIVLNLTSLCPSDGFYSSKNLSRLKPALSS